MRTITTVSGSVYEVDGMRVRRVNDHWAKRGDGEWQELVVPLREESYVGERMVLNIARLDRYGDDDYGNRGPTTVRMTSEVVSDER